MKEIEEYKTRRKSAILWGLIFIALGGIPGIGSFCNFLSSVPKGDNSDFIQNVSHIYGEQISKVSQKSSVLKYTMSLSPKPSYLTEGVNVSDILSLGFVTVFFTGFGFIKGAKSISDQLESAKRKAQKKRLEREFSDEL